VLLVEQNTSYALELADRGYVLENGRITLEGDSKSLGESEHVKKAYLGL
jgi:branched-chain amino acid transport system ATP-binding protein